MLCSVCRCHAECVVFHADCIVCHVQCVLYCHKVCNAKCQVCPEKQTVCHAKGGVCPEKCVVKSV